MSQIGEELVALINHWRSAAADPATYPAHSEILNICVGDLQAALENEWGGPASNRTPVSYRYQDPAIGRWSQWFDMSFENENYKKAVDWKWPMQFSYQTTDTVP